MKRETQISCSSVELNVSRQRSLVLLLTTESESGRRDMLHARLENGSNMYLVLLLN
jgi:hypothetical protein